MVRITAIFLLIRNHLFSSYLNTSNSPLLNSYSDVCWRGEIWLRSLFTPSYCLLSSTSNLSNCLCRLRILNSNNSRTKQINRKCLTLQKQKFSKLIQYIMHLSMLGFIIPLLTKKKLVGSSAYIRSSNKTQIRPQWNTALWSQWMKT